MEATCPPRGLCHTENANTPCLPASIDAFTWYRRRLAPGAARACAEEGNEAAVLAAWDEAVAVSSHVRTEPPDNTYTGYTTARRAYIKTMIDSPPAPPLALPV